jgi:hypothetical protein
MLLGKPMQSFFSTRRSLCGTSAQRLSSRAQGGICSFAVASRTAGLRPAPLNPAFVSSPLYLRLVLRNEGHPARSLRPARISRGRLFSISPLLFLQKGRGTPCSLSHVRLNLVNVCHLQHLGPTAESAQQCRCLHNCARSAGPLFLRPPCHLAFGLRTHAVVLLTVLPKFCPRPRMDLFLGYSHLEFVG